MTVSSIGPYRVVTEIARGGMGVVYRAIDPQLDRPVAVKVLLETSETALLRFRKEARATALLRHQHIVGVQSFGADKGHPYLVMELVEGTSLHQRVKQGGPLPGRQAARITEKLARALHYAHQQGVLHRDVKPANVLLDRQAEPRLTDFGLAKSLGRDMKLTMSGEILGTPVFMPPEQANARADLVGPRSDLYGLGATLYYMLTGSPPFRADTVVSALDSVLRKAPPSPSKLNPQVEPWLEAVCLRCLEKDPGDRYLDCGELAEALADPSSAEVESVRGGSPWGVVAALVVGVGLGAGGALLLGSRPAVQDPPQVAEPPPAPPFTNRELVADLKLLGQALVRTDPDRARVAFDRALRLDDQDAPLWAARAEVRFLQKDFQGAIADCEQALKLDPGLPEAYLHRGRARVSLQDLPGALQDLDRALELRAGWGRALAIRGAIKRAMGDDQGGKADLVQALEIEPKNVPALFNLAGLLLSEDRPRDALPLLEKLLDQDPAHMRGRFQLGSAFGQLGDHESSMRQFEVLGMLSPNNPWALLGRAMVLGDQRRNDEALEAFGAALERAPPDFPELDTIYTRRGMLYAMLHDNARAIADLRKAVENRPDNVMARFQLAFLLGEEQRFEASLRHLDAILNRAPQAAEVRLQRGWVLFRLDRLEEAQRELDWAVEKMPQQPGAWDYRARVLEKLEQLPRAITDYERAAQLYEAANRGQEAAAARERAELLRRQPP